MPSSSSCGPAKWRRCSVGPPITKSRVSAQSEKRAGQAADRSARAMTACAQKPWTKKDRDALERWWRVGVPSDEIGYRIGRSSPAVCEAARKLGLQKRGAPPWSACEDRKLAKWWKAGTASEEIAERLGRPLGAIAQRTRFLGIKRPEHKAQPVKVDMRRRCLSCGIVLPTSVPCYRNPCRAVREGAAPLGRDVRYKLSLVSSSMGD